MSKEKWKSWSLAMLFIMSSLTLFMTTDHEGLKNNQLLEETARFEAVASGASNNEGWISYVVVGYSECSTDVYGMDNITFMGMVDCPGYTILRSLANAGDVDLLNVSGWEVKDAAYLPSGDHLLSLSKEANSSESRSVFNESMYDGHTHLLAKMNNSGNLTVLGAELTYSMDDVNASFDVEGNLFLQGTASNKSQSPSMEINGVATSLDWTTIGHGPGCTVSVDFAPTFLTYYNRSAAQFDWLFQSPFLQPQPHATTDAIEGTFLFSTIGTPAQTFDCGTVPGTHTFGVHTAAAGEILASVSHNGTFAYAHNTGGFELISGSPVQVAVGQHGYTYRSAGSTAQYLVNEDGIKALPTTHPIVCERQNLTAYMYRGSPWSVDEFIWNQSRPSHHIDLSDMPDYVDAQSGRCIASHESMTFLASWIPWSSTRVMHYWSGFTHNSDEDWLADSIDAYPHETTQWRDSDGDGYGDNWANPDWNDTMSGTNPNGRWVEDAQLVDWCPVDYGTSFRDRQGCPDTDGDGWSDLNDVFIRDASQWEDTDSDGFGDNESGLRGDNCPYDYGTSTRGQWGCQDSDGDGWADITDAYPGEISQWNDTDGDGYGDSLVGVTGDACPDEYGTSFEDRWGCIDSDNDGWSDLGDAFPHEPTQHSDRDGDGYGDNQSQGAHQPDRYPSDSTQWKDTDGDGRGDNLNGNNGDAFPNDDAEWLDTDGDGVGNNADAFPFNPSQQVDTDGDGFGDNQRGNGADKFPLDPTQWSDIDGDGYGDNPDGNAPDAFIADPTQWVDTDNDGYGDNPSGRLSDAFVEEPTQWLDQDGDGLGDNQSGVDPDPYLFDFDNDGYNDSIDPLPKYASPGDLDNDGVTDSIDWAPADFREWSDSDGDGVGDNADLDDDNDGWTDTDEVRQGTDPFSSDSQPVEGFEVIIPGTQISLGAWDLIGMFGGVPLFIWIMFGLVTRNNRTAKFEQRLAEATTREELEEIANQWEYSLMLRLIGPHQGIRLERIRTELDDRLEAELFSAQQTTETNIDQTHLVERELHEQGQKDVPDLAFSGEEE